MNTLDAINADAFGPGLIRDPNPALTLSSISKLLDNDEESIEHSLGQSKILVIDDDEVILEALEKHLRQAGYENILTTSASESAFSRICSERPDIVLLDVMMPFSGLSVLELMRSNDESSRIPVVVLSAATDSKTKLRALELGANDFLTKPIDVIELLTRVRNNLLVKAHFDQLSRYSAKLEKAVFIDALTGAANRRGFEEELQRRLQERALEETALALLMVDIDHFKKVNDCYGHRAGDRMLRDVARTIAANTGPNAFVSRYGGEEFAVLQSCPVEDAVELAESIRTAVEDEVFVFNELQLRMTVSLGVTMAVDRDTEDTLFQRADSALYTSKQSGRNCTYLHNGTDFLRTSPQVEQLGGVATSSPFADGHAVHSLKNAKIMIVDDDPVMIMVVQKYLKDGGFRQFVSNSDAAGVLTMVRAQQPDIVLMDVRMPGMSGLEILESMRRDETIKHIPVIILTSSTDAGTKSAALELSANDFLGKPVDPSELILRVRNNLLVKAQHDRLAQYSEHLEFEVNRSTADLFASRNEVIQCLASAAECRDDQTGYHTMRVGLYAGIIARELQVDKETLSCIEAAAQLHDVGKIGISDLILKKAGRLTEDERDVMQCHAAMGERILSRCQSPVMRMAAIVAASHHEKWDGTGYPRGLAGESIPLEGRITAVADVFDALSTKRYYKDAYDLERCFAMIEAGRGTHFDPDVTDAFLRRKTDVVQVYREFADTHTTP